MYETAFLTDARDMARATGGDEEFHDAVGGAEAGGGGNDEEFHDAEGPYAVGVQVDNYVKDQGVRRHLFAGGVNNFVQTATESRMLAPCRDSTLESGDGGYGEAYDHGRLMGIFGGDNEASTFLDGAGSIWSFKDSVVAISTLKVR